MVTDQKVTRKLRAIFSADVKGYSILMADDEVSTVQTLKEYRKIMSACIEQLDGRVVDAVGDNLLAEFESAVDAVQCSVEVQKELKEKKIVFFAFCPAPCFFWGLFALIGALMLSNFRGRRTSGNFRGRSQNRLTC